jgi:NAD-dependent SIR2 family protein deacetylase
MSTLEFPPALIRLLAEVQRLVVLTGAGISAESGIPTFRGEGGLLRPNVVRFGEALDSDILRRAEAALSRCQVVLVVGTSAVVQPAASMALWAQHYGARLIEINPEPTPLTPHCDFTLTGPAGEVLPAILGHII